tara:strand:- start:76 stop:399 length:324 start_codon:yes stop_codon:yes gene_type:complete
MTSTAGWARSNILYDTLVDTPVPGSPLESVLAFVFMSRQRAEFIKTKAMLQALATKDTKEATEELLESLHEYMFPDIKEKKWKERTKAREVMEKHMTPIAVSPISSK